MADLSYHDLHITTDKIKRTSIFNLPYGLEISCNRVTGWTLWEMNNGVERMIAGEYDREWLVLDVAGHVILDTRNR